MRNLHSKPIPRPMTVITHSLLSRSRHAGVDVRILGVARAALVAVWVLFAAKPGCAGVLVPEPDRRVGKSASADFIMLSWIIYGLTCR